MATKKSAKAEAEAPTSEAVAEPVAEAPKAEAAPKVAEKPAEAPKVEAPAQKKADNDIQPQKKVSPEELERAQAALVDILNGPPTGARLAAAPAAAPTAPLITTLGAAPAADAPVAPAEPETAEEKLARLEAENAALKRGATVSKIAAETGVSSEILAETKIDDPETLRDFATKLRKSANSTVAATVAAAVNSGGRGATTADDAYAFMAEQVARKMRGN